MLFRHSEAFLFIRFGPVLPLQHHAPPTLSHRPLLSFHSTPSVPLIPLIQSHLPAFLPLHFVPHAHRPSLHCHFPDPLLSLRLFIPLSGPRSASSIHSTPSIAADTFNRTRQHPVSIHSRPEYRRATAFKSLRKTKNGEARAANPNPPGRMPITSPPSPVFSTFPNDDSETLCTMSQLLTRNSSLPPDAHGLETLFRTARCLRKGTNNCRVL